uniref:ADP-ribosylation factor-like protein 6 n=1 Tax=Acrobeloides nanus TaxID=290746 RepID=A0A914EBR3_9BILA
MGIVISMIFDTSLHRVVLLGLDGAGKTTVLYRLKWQEIVLPPPTIGFNCEKFRSKHGLSRGHGFIFWDVEGQDHARSLWRTYLKQASAVVFVVDARDSNRFEEVKTEIEHIVRLKDFASHAPILLLGNKQDKISAIPADELLKKLSIDFKNHPVYPLGCCALTGEGLECMFDELLYAITESKAAYYEALT